MKKFLVTVPTTGSISIEVEAESKESALLAFYDAYDSALDSPDHEWEFCEKLHSGNVCHVGTPWEVEIEES